MRNSRILCSIKGGIVHYSMLDQFRLAIIPAHLSCNRLPMSTREQLVRFFEVSSESDNQRVDNFLLSRLKGVPRSHLYRMLRKGAIRLNKKRIKADTRVHAGDLLRVAPVQLADRAVVPAPSAGLVEILSNAVLYEDENILVLNKPQGLAVHAGSGAQLGLIEALRQMRPEGEALELVHRLDKATTGCLLITKNYNSLKFLQDQFKAKTTKKVYQALVAGQWPDHVKKIEVALRKDTLDETEKRVRVDSSGKPALTHFKVLQRFSDCTLLQVMPETGRTHQIRVHCQYAGHAIIGDDRYTQKVSSRLMPVKRLCLHAESLLFALPDNEQQICINAPMGPAMQDLITRLQQ
ncbi:MAG: RluA family pseudouridine synthase [Pseudomonadales bacterium]|nr:RluA family pseudouridine synthase [Pseudomonadales bacterium]